MSVSICIKRGTTDKIAEYAGMQGELVFDTEAKALYVMDGINKGGHLIGIPEVIDGGIIPEPMDYKLVFTTGESRGNEGFSIVGYSTDSSIGIFGEVDHIPYWYTNKSTGAAIALTAFYHEDAATVCFYAITEQRNLSPSNAGRGVPQGDFDITMNITWGPYKVQELFHVFSTGGKAFVSNVPFATVHAGQDVTIDFDPKPDGFI